MEDELKMILTGYKEKIPHTLSYCCNAKTLSLAWQGVPQFDNFDLLFVCNVSRELYKNDGTRFILRLSYSQWHPTTHSRFQEIREDGKRMWNIYVGACRRADAHEIRDWLSSTGLEQARLWLEQRSLTNPNGNWWATFDEDSRICNADHN